MKSFLKTLVVLLILLVLGAAGVFLVNAGDENLNPELAAHYTSRPQLTGLEREKLALWMGVGRRKPQEDGEKFLRIIESLPAGPMNLVSERLKEAGWLGSQKNLPGEELASQMKAVYAKGPVDLRPLIGTGISFALPSVSAWGEGHRVWCKELETRKSLGAVAAFEELRMAVEFSRNIWLSESVFVVKAMALSNLHLTAQTLHELLLQHPDWAAKVPDDLLTQLNVKDEIPEALEGARIGEVKDLTAMLDEVGPAFAEDYGRTRFPVLMAKLTFALLQKNKTLNWVWTIEGEELAGGCNKPLTQMCSKTYNQVTRGGPRWLVNPTGRQFVMLVAPRLRNMRGKWTERAEKIEDLVHKLQEAKKLPPGEVKAFLGTV